MKCEFANNTFNIWFYLRRVRPIEPTNKRAPKESLNNKIHTTKKSKINIFDIRESRVYQILPKVIWDL